MSKRLEEIEKEIQQSKLDLEKDDTINILELDKAEWLIEYAKEQAERVQELERVIKMITGISYAQLENRIKNEREWFSHQTDLVEEKTKLKKQNKRYREAIENALDEGMMSESASQMMREALESDSDE